MSVVGVGPQAAETYPRPDWQALRSEAQERRRISRRRAFGLGLPGLVCFDAALVTGSFLAALRILPATRTPPATSATLVGPQLLALFAVLVAGFLLFGGMFGLYSRRSLLVPRRAMASAARALFWSGGVAIVFAFLLALDPPGDLRWLLLTHAGLLTLGAVVVRPLICRGLMRLALVGPMRPRRLLVLGGDGDAQRVAAALESEDAREVEIAGIAAPHLEQVPDRPRWARFRLDGWEDGLPLADALAADEVILASRELERPDAVRLAFRLARIGVSTRVVPHLTRLFVEGTPVNREQVVPLARLGRGVIGSWQRGSKRAVDVGFTLLGGLLLLPLLLLISLAVKLTSSGPILYGQTRVGRGGRTFQMYKFRSMVVANDDSHHRRYVASLLTEGNAAGEDASGRPVYKIVDDPRVTMIGRLIRATSLDELPQLINVLRGEMSLIGPRPCLPFEYELYQDWQRRRLDVTPGMTGLWQVSGRNLLSFEEMVLLDLYYVANWTFWLDLRILWLTIPEILNPQGVR